MKTEHATSQPKGAAVTDDMIAAFVRTAMPASPWPHSDPAQTEEVRVNLRAAIGAALAAQSFAPQALTITPLEEQQMFDDWCPYKGTPDPRVVWAAAIEAVNGMQLQASQAPAPAPEVPDGYKLVLLPDESPEGEPDWEEVRRQAEVATGIKVERNTFSIVIREVRRWLAHRATTPTVIYSPIQVNSHAVEMGREHPNNCETPDEDRFKYLDLRGDDKGQGLSVYWKWGHAAGWNDHKKHVAATQAPAVARQPLTAHQRAVGFGESSLTDDSPQGDVWHAACVWTERAHGIGEDKHPVQV